MAHFKTSNSDGAFALDLQLKEDDIIQMIGQEEFDAWKKTAYANVSDIRKKCRLAQEKYSALVSDQITRIMAKRGKKC